jgi:pimeloyl-ACP methyl ester carboxylesterase
MRHGLRKRLVDKLKAARERSDVVVIVAHSMGTMIAYDCLRNDPDCPEVAGLITLGSPLGVDEIQDPLIPGRDKTKAFPERLKGPWVNVYDPLDPVCALDPRLANDFLRNGAPAIRDIHESNWGDWRHTITHYLAGPQLRAAVRELAGL